LILLKNVPLFIFIDVHFYISFNIYYVFKECINVAKTWWVSVLLESKLVFMFSQKSLMLKIEKNYKCRI